MSVLRAVRIVSGATGWILVTLWLGLVGTVRIARVVFGLRRALATTLLCPRGHRVELYGAFRCPRCHAAREGRVFDPCPVCGARPAYIDCERCGLAVKAPIT